MSELQIGDAAPEFSLPASGGETIALADLRGQKVVVYFYPRDDTPGCTKEAIGFTESIDGFKDADCVVLGISKDTVAKHDKFVAKHDLGIALLSDAEAETVEAYGAWVEKAMYGKTYMGIERATFLIDREGRIARVWRKVKVPGHVDEVLAAARELA